MTALKWTVLWSKGPVDNPTDGEFEVEADTFAEAAAEADRRLYPHGDCIDGIVRSDIWRDL